MTFSIRQASPLDHTALCPLFEAFYREEGFADAVAGVSGNLTHILSRSDTAAFIAEIDGDAIGAAAVSTSFGLEAGLYAELEDLYVAIDHRGKGVATALIDASCAWAQSIGCHDVEIIVTEHGRDIAGLVPFYTRHDFTVTGRMIMERAL